MLLTVLLLLPGCRCNESPGVAVRQTLPHYAEFDGLVAASWRGKVDLARTAGRDLTEGAPTEWEGGQDAAAKVGAALGFLQMAESTDEVADAVAAASLGCGKCHMAAGVGSPAPPPPWTHEHAAEHVVYGLVWTAPLGPPPGGEPPLDALAQAWNEPVVLDSASQVDERSIRAGRVIATCAECHQKR